MNKDVIVLFSGCGGFSEGFKQAGFNIIYALDNWKYALQSHELNHPGAEHVLDDIRNIDDVPSASVVIGSPPCQKFSRLNKDANHEEGLQLVREFERIVKIVKPEHWVWENVPPVAPYYRNSSILDAYDFGLAQHRKRCFVSNFSFVRNNVLPGVQTEEIFYDGHLNNTASGHKHRTCSGTVTTKRPRYAGSKKILSIDEVKHLMGFPLEYQLSGKVTAQQKQLGNAVCPPVAKVIAEAIKELL